MLNPVDIVEKFVQISLQGFEGQVNALHFLGYHQYRNELANNLNQMVLHLLEVIKKEEVDILEDVKVMTEQALSESAMVRNTIVNAHRENERVPELKMIAHNATVGHHNLTKGLSQMESEATNKISTRFSKMKKDVQNLLNRVDTLRRC